MRFLAFITTLSIVAAAAVYATPIQQQQSNNEMVKTQPVKRHEANHHHLARRQTGSEDPDPEPKLAPHDDYYTQCVGIWVCII